LYGDKKLPLLHYAAIIDKFKSLEILLAAGAEIDKVYSDETPLMSASWFGCGQAVQFLIKKVQI
jgi:ankyrin repeat protein